MYRKLRIAVLLLIFFVVETPTFCQTGDDAVFVSVVPKGGNTSPVLSWGAAATWKVVSGADSDGVPDKGDAVQILDDDHTIQLSDAREVKSLTFLDGNGNEYNHTVVFTEALSSLIVTSDIIFKIAPNSSNSSQKLLNVGPGTLLAGSLQMDMSTKGGSGTKAFSRIGIFRLSSGKATILNDINLNINNSTAQATNDNYVQLTGNGNLYVGGDFVNGSLFTDPSTYSTVHYFSTRNQKVIGANYQNLIIDSAGVKTLTGGSTVGDSLSVKKQAVFDVGNLTINGSPADRYLKVENGARLKIGGNKTFPASYLNPILELNSTVEYYGAVQEIANYPKYGNLEISGTDTSGKTAIGNVTINNNITINSNGVFRANWGSSTLFTHTVGGNWSNSGNFLGANSTIDFINTSNIQTISGSSTTVFNNLKLSKQGKDLWLSTPIEVNGILTFSQGLINSGPTNRSKVTFNAIGTHVGASASAFINGPVAKAGTAVFSFPIGKDTAGRRFYAPLEIGTSTVSSTYTSEYFPVSALTWGTGRHSGIRFLSNCEYWNFKRDAGSGTPDVSLTWSPTNACAGPSYIVQPSDIKIAAFNTTKTNPGAWDVFGGSGIGTATNGKVTLSTSPNFVPLTLASIASLSSLPIRFANLTATEQAAGVQVDFSNMTEEDVAKYYIERSADGNQFSVVGSLAPRLNNNQRVDYTYPDAAPLHGDNYYRIRGVETTGKTIYSDVVRLVVNAKGQGLHIYPNPARVNSTVQLQLGVLPAGKYQLHVYNQNGQAVRATSFVHTGGNVSTPVSTMGMVPGRYLVELSGAQKWVRTLVLH